MKKIKNRILKLWAKINLSPRAQAVLKYIGAITFVIAVEQGMIFSIAHIFNPVLAAFFYSVDVPFFFLMSDMIIPFVLKRPYRVLKLILSFILSFGLFIVLQNLAQEIALWCTSADFSFSVNQLGFKRPFWRGVTIVIYALAYYGGKEGIKRAKEARNLEVKNLQLETAYLRSKIKPHFIFNTLQFIYGQVAKTSPATAETISLFADVIQYAQDSDEADGTVANEVAQVNNYIALNMARLGDQLCLDLSIQIDESSANLSIPPLLIINIIENMFIHGQLYKEESPAKVSIRCIERKLEVHVRNLKAYTSKFKTTGFGLNYVLRQLEKTYPNRHAYTINDADNFYELQLTVNL